MLNLKFNPFPVITTQRLKLRRLRKEDADEMFVLRSDEQVMKYIDRPRAKTVEDALAFIDKLDKQEDAGDSITWGITLKDEDKVIGMIGIWNIKKEHYRAEVGYALVTGQHGKGLMQEALDKVLEYGFRTMNLHSFEANVNPENIVSIRLLERNGFIREGYFRQNYYFNGRFLDSGIYSLLRRNSQYSAI